MSSKRSSLRLPALFAITCTDADGFETICTRETMGGPQPWIFDDDKLALIALDHIKLTRDPRATLVAFMRAT